MLPHFFVLMFLIATPSSWGQSGTPKQPNILFILADDVGTEVLGCYGGQSYETPRIDSLAADGQKYRHCYSMPVCHPSRLAIMTGLYPNDLTNQKWGSFPVEMESKTIAHAMKFAGYKTAVAGKWQLAIQGKDVNHPERLGFDQSCLFGWHEGARYHDPYLWQNGQKLENTEGTYGPDHYTDFLISFMKENRESPFFAYYSMALCHDVTDDLKAPVPYAPGKDRYLNYEEMVDSMDLQVGKLIDALNELGIRENTYIIFTGDNGTASRSIVRAEKKDGDKKWTYLRDEVWSEINGEKIRGGKGSLTDHGTRVPLLINRPGSVQKGEYDDLIDFSDFLPTFLELASSDTPDWGPQNKSTGTFRGISFASRILQNEPSTRAFAYSQSKGSKFWVRDQRWKLYNNGQFFDIENDPREKRNLGKSIPPEGAESHRQLSRVIADKLNWD